MYQYVHHMPDCTMHVRKPWGSYCEKEVDALGEPPVPRKYIFTGAWGPRGTLNKMS